MTHRKLSSIDEMHRKELCLKHNTAFIHAMKKYQNMSMPDLIKIRSKLLHQTDVIDVFYFSRLFVDFLLEQRYLFRKRSFAIQLNSSQYLTMPKNENVIDLKTPDLAHVCEKLSIFLNVNPRGADLIQKFNCFYQKNKQVR